MSLRISEDRTPQGYLTRYRSSKDLRLILKNRYSTLFDGVNEYVDCGNCCDFERTDPFSVNCWFYMPVGTAANGMLISKRENAGNRRGWSFTVQPGPGALIAVDLTNVLSVNGIQVDYSVPSGHLLGFWHNTVMSYDGSSNANGVNLYLDAVPQVGVIALNTLSATIKNAVNTMIGSREGLGVFYTGNIDEVEVYDRVLTQAEVTALYNDGKPADPTVLGSKHSLLHQWMMGDYDTFNTIDDHIGANPGTMVNMEAGDFVKFTP